MLQQWQPSAEAATAQTWARHSERRKQHHNGQSNTSGSLRDRLLSVLTNSDQASDQAVANTIKQVLQPCLQPTHAHDYSRARSTNRDHHNRWSNKKQKSCALLNKVLIVSEWTKQPVLRDAAAFLNDIRESNPFPQANISVVNCLQQAKSIQATWKAYGPTGYYTVLLTGQAKAMDGATPTRIRVLRK